MADAEHGMWQWLERYGLLGDQTVREHLVRTRPHYTAALYFPHLDAEKLLPTANFTALGFLIDDLFDDTIAANDLAAVTRLNAELVGVSLSQRKPTTNLGRACRDVLDTLSAGQPPRCRTVLGKANARWLATYLVEAWLAAQGQTMGLTEYLAHRRHSVGEEIYLALEEFTSGLDLPSEVRGLPAMVQARERAMEWIGLHNDIHSCAKEEAVGYPHNAVLITRARCGGSIQQSVDTVNDVLTGLIRQFQAASAAVPAQARAVTGNDPAIMNAVEHALDGYRKLIRSNYTYHIGTARYEQVSAYLPQE
ncbi:terpene synthase family protein [Amycolatopsis lurida]